MIAALSVMTVPSASLSVGTCVSGLTTSKASVAGPGCKSFTS